ncbi:MAG: protein-L-isoaspartate O-methyltransferase [Methanobacteriota archaeon]
MRSAAVAMARDDERARMVARLESNGHVRSERVRDAMLKVERHLFLPENAVSEAYRDTPLPIGNGQTISAPHMVAMMAELLAPEPGQKVLEVGGGTGYHAAVMAELVGMDGLVVTIERIHELAVICRENLAKAGYPDVMVIEGDGALGHLERAPYDCMLVACAARKIPEALTAQLAEGGRLAIPLGGGRYQELMLATKKAGRLAMENHGGVAFVPLISDKV